MIISVLIPCYNEEKTILEILGQVNAQKIPGFQFEVIVVDDGSKDSTPSLLKANPNLYTKFYQMPKNGGKGAAVRAGLGLCTGEYVLFQDADLEYDPKDYEKLLMPISNFSPDVVMGSRFLAPTYTRVFYFWHKVGNRMITLLFNVANNTTFTDIYSCYLMFKRNLMTPADLKTDGWQQHAEILSLAVRRGKVFYEVPISYFGRTYEEGKKIRARHVIGVFWTILTSRFRSAR